MTFTGTDGIFILDNSANTGAAPGSIFGFVQGDRIDLRDITAGPNATPGYSGTATGGTLTVSDGANTVDLRCRAASDVTPGGALITTDITAPHA